jgi:hypothetical protein
MLWAALAKGLASPGDRYVQVHAACCLLLKCIQGLVKTAGMPNSSVELTCLHHHSTRTHASLLAAPSCQHLLLALSLLLLL